MLRGGVDGNDLKQDTDKYRVTVNAVMAPSGSIKYREFLKIDEEISAFQKGLCFMELTGCS